jgi:hypothetical protein
MIDYDLILIIDNRQMKTMRVITGIGEKMTRHDGDAVHNVVDSDPMNFFDQMEIIIPFNSTYKGMLNNDCK